MTSSPATDATAWHAKAAVEVCRVLGVDPAVGLDPAEVERRRAQFGPKGSPRRRRSPEAV
jgi:cation-transporting P-type ATPase F